MSDTIKDISKLKVADLKRELKVRGLSTVGNKQDLQDRLQIALQDGTDSALLLDDTGTVDPEDILNEDDVLADEDDSNTHAPPDVENSSLKRQLDEDTVTSTPAKKPNSTQGDGEPPAKKIILNRKVLSQQAAPAAEISVQDHTPATEDEGKKVVKLSEVSMKERLALRAVKFGAPTSVDAKKLARAARFGEATSDESKKGGKAARLGTSATSVTAAKNAPEVNVDLLKKRAERFGIQPGSKIEQVENEEKKKRRLERFGESSAAATNGSSKVVTSKSGSTPAAAKVRIPIKAPASSASSESSVDDKKKLRAERFKTSAVISAK